MQLKQLFIILPVALITSACTAANQAAAQPNMMMAQPQMQQQMQASAPLQGYDAGMQYGAALSMQQQALENLKSYTTAQMNSMDERVRRVERAMIRLDRRMQVIERSELSRMSNADVAGAGNGQFQPTSFNATDKAPVAVGRDYGQMTSPFARGAAVLSRTSYGANDAQPLENAFVGKHVSIAPLQPAKPMGGVSGAVAAGPRIASLADKDTATDEKTDVTVWTVSYDPRKIWPDRSQLASSSDVVKALRSGDQVTVFARGARPSSKEFRERVRALSRYLGRVANLDSVPIAAMPAEHLSSDTIEVLVAH